MDVNKLVTAYVNIRDKRDELRREYNDADAGLSEKIEKIKGVLLALYKERGVESLRTAAGTATRMVKTRYSAPDWTAFVEFVKENDAIDLLEKRIAQTNFRQFVEENPDVVVPVRADSEYTIRVTRARGSK